MTVRQQLLAAVVGAAAGIATVLMTDAPGLGGAILGVAITAGLGIHLLDRRSQQLHQAAEELAKARWQYEAAHASLAGQRERMRIAQREASGLLAERTAQLNAAHQRELAERRCQWFEEGATAALTGRIALSGRPTVASVIPIGSHRQR